MRRTFSPRLARGLLAIAAALSLSPAAHADIGQIKIAKGHVTIERDGRDAPGAVGARRKPPTS